MAMDNSGLSIGDALALTGKNDGFLGGTGGSMIALIIVFILLFGNGGWGYGRGGYDAGVPVATSADVQRGFNNNEVTRKLDGITYGICDSGYANAQLINGVNGSIAELGFTVKDCCCTTNRNIDSVKYENAKNTADIITANNLNTRDILEAQNAGTQRIIDYLTKQEIDSLRSDLQSAQLTLANNVQTNAIVNAVRPFPQPAYITCSPYTSASVGCGCTGTVA